MNRSVFARVLMVLGMVLVPASFGAAAVISRDWKTPGDGLLTYDDVNQREWLDLSQTLLTDQFPGGPPVFPGPIERRYEYVVGQTGPGGLFAGFNVAKSPDVIALAQSAGIDTSTQHFPINATATVALSDLLSYTIPPPANNRGRLTIGLLDEFQIINEIPYRLNLSLSTIFSSQSGARVNSDHLEFPNRPPGVMLYRGVPDPRRTCWRFLPCWREEVFDESHLRNRTGDRHELGRARSSGRSYLKIARTAFSSFPCLLISLLQGVP